MFVVVGRDNKEKLDSCLHSGRLLGKEQVREKHKMKGSAQNITGVCVCVCVCVLILASRRWGFTEGGRVCESPWFMSGVRMDEVIIWKDQHIGNL